MHYTCIKDEQHTDKVQKKFKEYTKLSLPECVSRKWRIPTSDH